MRATSVDDVKGALREIILPLFAPKTANIVVTCATVMEEVSLSSLIKLRSCSHN